MQVRVHGQLICRSADEAEIVLQHLPLHVSLTRAEPGWVKSFEVRQTADPLVWQVEEQFVDEAAFDAHQERVAMSEWGRATSGIERRYAIEGITRAES